MRLSIVPVVVGVLIGAWLVMNNPSARQFFEYFFASVIEWWNTQRSNGVL